MTRLATMALGAILLTACAGPNLYTVEDACGANSRPFADTWPCVRAGAASLPGAYDLKQYYFATGDVVAERIREGNLTEAQGRLIMAHALNEVMGQSIARAPSGGGYYRPTVYQRTGPETVIAY